MGNNSVSVDFKKTSNAITFTVKQTANDWDILFEQPAGKYKVWKLNGKLIQPEKIGSVARIKIGSKNAHISLSN